jgi:small-conductance mechanosensitive channel
MELYGVKLIGVNMQTAEKLLFTLVLIACFIVLRLTLKALTQLLFSRYREMRLRFWTRQGIDVGTIVILVLGLLSIWFNNPANLALGAGLATAGVAFALQQVITSLAGYLVILRGKTFNVGDRITMGGVRGDVIALGFMQTTIMEMGQPPSVQDAQPAMWVGGDSSPGASSR